MHLRPIVMPQSLITPREPSVPRNSGDVPQATHVAEQSIRSKAFRRIEAAVASSCGSQHDSNEDAHSGLDAAGSLFVVADGVGGGAMAQMASRQLVAHLCAALDAAPLDADLVRRVMLDADRAIAHSIAKVSHSPGAATVALCAPVNLLASKWLIAWVGDCRVYRLAMRGQRAIELLTCDDTFRHLGEQPPPGGALDDPARMVGNGATAGANVALHDLACGDLLVLCSDGVHKFLDSDTWSQVLTQRTERHSLARRCEHLIAQARANGSVDDATVLVVQRFAYNLPRPGWIKRWAESGGSAGTPRNVR